MNHESSHAPTALIDRRRLVAGALWTTPLVVVGAPAANAGLSMCTIANPGVISFGPRAVRNVDAVCASNSQSPDLNVARIRTQYGYAYLPGYVEICNCVSQSGWYRFRETDTLSNFQIEVDGRHNDQNNTTTAGYRPAFRLTAITDPAGSCQQFPMTYRTSASRPFSAGATIPTTAGTYHDVTFTVTLQRNPSTSATAPGVNDAGWANVGTSISVSGVVWRRIRTSNNNNSDPINFSICWPQSGGVTSSAPNPAARGAAPETEVNGDGGVTGDGEISVDGEISGNGEISGEVVQDTPAPAPAGSGD